MIATRRILVTALALVLAVALVVTARGAADATPTSDTAVIESDTLVASSGELLVGIYSRFQWHHPGPATFYWMVPFYALSGHRTVGLNAAALALNLTALALMTAVILRRSGGVMAVALVGFTAVFAWRGAEVLTSPWSPHLTVFPMMALIITVADAISGTPAALPIVCALASLVGQAYVGLLPSAIALGGVALAGAVVGPVAAANGPTRNTRSQRRALLVSAVVLAALWLPPLIDQFTGHPGNLTLLWKFFVTESHPGQTFSAAVSAWSDMMTGLARPDFYVAHGWVFRESPVKWSEALAIVEIIALLLSGALAFRARRRFELALSAILILTTVLALWSATRIQDAIIDHEVFWNSGVGVLNLALLAALIARPIAGRLQGFRTIPTGALCGLLLATTIILGVRHLREAVAHSFAPGIESETASAVAADLRTYLAEQHSVRPLIRIDQDAWGMVAGVILQLQKSGVPVAVEDDWLVMFTPGFAATGQEPFVLTIAGKAQHVRMLDMPGDRVIVSRDPLFVHRETAAPAR